jgi:hypothetical protein
LGVNTKTSHSKIFPHYAVTVTVLVSFTVSFSVAVTVTVKIWLGGMGVMISGPSAVEEGTGADSGEEGSGAPVGTGISAVSEVGSGAGDEAGGASGVEEGTGSGAGGEEEKASVGAGGPGTSDVEGEASGTEEEVGCTGVSGGGSIEEDGCVETWGISVVILDGDSAGGADGTGISDVEDETTGGVGIGSATCDEETIAYVEDGIGSSGSGTADETGTSVGSGTGAGVTVVNDVMITTGGTCKEGETSAGVFDTSGVGS